jgi:G:T/U-mismatch repair DNA glycosylase
MPLYKLQYQMVTIHKYIDENPIKKESKKLILGTIHPHNDQKFIIPFFYGNKNSIWNLLHDAFPNELSLPLSRDNIISFLDRRRIAMSDTILQCRRTNATALDSDLIVEKLNPNLITQIRESEIDHIFCTSGFGKNNAFKLFYQDLLGLKITPEIKKAREVILPASIFGTEILVTVLYSPSGSSNISLSRNAEFLKNRDRYTSARPVYDFKVDYYRKQFS